MSNKRIFQLNVGVMSDTSFFPVEAAPGNVTERISGANVKSYLASGGFLNSTDIGVTVEAFDATILKSADIGVTVQPFNSGILTTSDIGVNVEAFDATILKSADIGVSVQGFDATILKSADIGVSVQGFDATILKSADIGVTVQGFDATILVSADIGSTVQAQDSDLDDIAALSHAAGNVIRSDGTNWQSAVLDFNDLGDVVITAPALGEVISYDGTNFVNAAPGAAVLAFDDLTDVIISTPAINDIISYDGTNFINGTSITINDITANEFVQLPVYSVVGANALTSQAVGQIIYVTLGDNGTADCLATYNGTDWKVVALGATIA